jgi:hypothetical protein
VNQVAYFFNQHIFCGIAFPGVAGKSDDSKINIVECDLEGPGYFIPMLSKGIYFAYIMLTIEFKRYGKRYGIHVT